MSDTQSINLAGFEAQLAGASVAVREFASGAAKDAADDVGRAFERAGDRITRALGSAASRGESLFARMAKSILEDMAMLALDRLFPSSSGGSNPFFGARAAGGAVNAGGAYLVGENGPELFVPHQSGEVAAPGGGAVNIHFHLSAGADAGAITRNQGQIAAAIARAVAYGRRNL
ncbi:MAG: phage tail tape measure C-terminal domain-containing protein [Terricaulis sp.]